MKLNTEDHAILVKLLENGFKWVARDSDSFLWAYKEKPIKNHTFDGEWDTDRCEPCIVKRKSLEFIKWEDVEPTEISKVLDLHDSAVEKEETGFKAGDKVWVDFPEYFNRDTVYTVKRIDSLGYADFTDTIYTAHTTRLSKAVTEEPTETPDETNSNTPVKPVIPDYVATALEEASYLDKWKIPSYLQSQSNYRADQRLHTWLEDNMDVVMQALVNGYEVDETRFYALIKGHEKVEDGFKYWAFNVDGSLTVEDLDPTIDMTATLGKWGELGITDDNAVFIEEGKL